MARATSIYQEARPFLPMYANLMISALLPIYTGAYASLSRPSSAAKAEKETLPEDAKEEEDEQQMEGLTPQDALIFPLTAAVVLAVLYWLITSYGASMINLILGWYFAVIGVVSVGKLINDTWSLIDSFVWPTYYRDQGKIWHVDQKERSVSAVSDGDLKRSSPFPLFLGRIALPSFLAHMFWRTRGMTKQRYTTAIRYRSLFELKATMTQHNVLSAITGTSLVLYSTLVDKPWWLTNIQGFSVSYGALQLMSPTTFLTGSLVLVGLFVYDIWAVFFTPLMVTVAKNLDVPIKMVFPRPEEINLETGQVLPQSYSMLGLGDIVLPGIMMALALRFDLALYYLRKQKFVVNKTGTKELYKAPYVPVTGYWGDKLLLRGSKDSALPPYLTASFPPTYFIASLIGYVIGMIATLIAMNIMQHAQPALLYLVPGVLISLWGTGLVRGELAWMWEYDETITGEPDDAEEEPTQKHDNSDGTTLWSWFRALVGFSQKIEKPNVKAAGTENKPQDNTEDVSKSNESPGSDKLIKKQKRDGPIFSFTISYHSPPTKVDNPPEPKEKSSSTSTS